MDKDIIIRSIGLGYILLGGYYYFGSASINSQTIAGLSVAAFLLVLSDCFQIYSEKYSKKSVIHSGLQYLGILANAIAIIFIVVFPFLDLRFTDDFYDILGTTLLLGGLGLSILLIAKKDEIKMEAYQEDILNMIKSQRQYAREIGEILKSHREEMERLNEEGNYEESMNKKE